MRTLRLGLPIALSATLAFGVYTTYPGSNALALALTQMGLLTGELDRQLNTTLMAMIASAEIGPNGKILFNRAIGDQRFLRPNTGRYWQISGAGQEDFQSRSLWDRRLRVSGRQSRTEPLYYNSNQFPDEPLRIVERTIRLPGSDVEWQFVVARSLDDFD